LSSGYSFPISTFIRYVKVFTSLHCGLISHSESLSEGSYGLHCLRSYPWRKPHKSYFHANKPVKTCYHVIRMRCSRLPLLLHRISCAHPSASRQGCRPRCTSSRTMRRRHSLPVPSTRSLK
jgi:hypothetical protein